MATSYNSIYSFGAPASGLAGSVPGQPPGAGMFPGFLGAALPAEEEMNFDFTGTLGGQNGFMTPLDPGAGAQGGFLGGIGGLQGLGKLAQGLASLGGIYSAIQGMGMAKDQFKFTKQAYRENLTNQKQTYNTSLEDRIRVRYHSEGRAAGAVQNYLNKHSL